MPGAVVSYPPFLFTLGSPEWHWSTDQTKWEETSNYMWFGIVTCLAKTRPKNRLNQKIIQLRLIVQNHHQGNEKV